MVFSLAGCKSTPTRESAAAGGPTMDTAKGPRIYVTDEVSGGLTVIDATTMKPLETLHIGTRPRGIHASPDGKTLYIALSGTPIGGPGVDEDKLPPSDHTKDGIGVFDIAANKLTRTIPGGSDPENFDLSKDGKKLYISNEDESAVSIVDIASGQVEATLKIGAQPEGVKTSPDGTFVYVTSEAGGTISVLDPAAKKITATVNVGHRPRNIAFTPDGKTAYVNAENDGSVVVVDVPQKKMVKTIPLGTPGQVKPMFVLMAPEASKLYVSTGRGGTLATIDIRSGTVAGQVAVGKRPWGIALSPDGTTLYTANGPSNDVSAVDLASNTVRAKAPAGGSPWGLVVLP